MRRLVAGAVAAMLLASAVPGRAQDAASCDDRVRLIADRLDLDAKATRAWYWAWMFSGAALIAGQGALAAIVHPGHLRDEFIVGSASSVFIPLNLLVQPPRVMRDAHAFDGRPAEPCLVLPEATQHLVRDANDQALRTGGFSHALVIGGSIALGLLLGVGFHDWPGGVKQTVGGIIISELQILTVPTGALQMQGLGFAATF
jgi:hypothetical protein